MDFFFFNPNITSVIPYLTIIINSTAKNEFFFNTYNLYNATVILTYILCNKMKRKLCFSVGIGTIFVDIR